MSFRRFLLSNQSGAITPLMLVLLIGILLLTGIALDLLKHEAQRADLQAALDRGVLAASSLSQQSDVEAVVRSYVEKGVDFGDQVDVQVSIGSNTQYERSVTATASYKTDTMFLAMVGLHELTVPAEAAAIDGLSGIEISLVLDRSGSMRRTSKIGTLRTASQSFVTIIEDKYGADRATISLLPYAANINPGAEIFGFLQVQSQTNAHTCPRFQALDYLNTHLPAQGDFQHSRNDDCPDENNRISYISNDFTDLRRRIGQLEAYGWTGTYLAMKWAVALLNPSLRTNAIYQMDDGSGQMVSFTEKLRQAGLMPDINGRPAAYDDGDTLKVIVLMTDGEINPPWTRRGRDPSHAIAEGWFDSICANAKDAGIIIYTIAFEASPTAQSQMATCASSASTFYDVNGLDLITAFEQIAQDITRLKLTN